MHRKTIMAISAQTAILHMIGLELPLITVDTPTVPPVTPEMHLPIIIQVNAPNVTRPQDG